MADFHFDSTSTTPYVSAPSSPRLSSFAGGNGSSPFGNYYTSAPTSPSAAAAFYHHFRAAAQHGHSRSASSVIPFDWEETPGTPKRHHQKEEEEDQKREPAEEEEDCVDDFAFEFSGQLPSSGGMEPITATADELFEEGKIRPLKLPPRLHVVHLDVGCGAPASTSPSPTISPKSPVSPRARFLWSPRGRRRASPEDVHDPFEKAIEETTRGREPGYPTASGATRRSRRAARSLSPLRGMFDIFSTTKPVAAQASPTASKTAAVTTTTSSAAGVATGFKRWRLKDLFLFRSASEGRATAARSKDPLRKHTPMSTASASLLSAAAKEDRNSSFRSTDGSVGGRSRRVVSRDGSGSVGGSSRRGRSPHEAHYTANRAVSEELRKKTFLPYRRGLLGCLTYNPAIEGLARGFGWSGHRRQ